MTPIFTICDSCGSANLSMETTREIANPSVAVNTTATARYDY